MICDVVLSKEKTGYVARAKEWPEVTVKEKSREKAIFRIKSKLLDYLTNKVELVQIDIPVPSKKKNPWMEKFGWFKDDPTFDDFEAEIAAYRKEIDGEILGK